MTKPTPPSEPIVPVELERYADAAWALQDPEVQRHYRGQWVVAYERRILAHGPEAQAVLDQAARLEPGQVHRLVLCLPGEGAEWLQHSSDPSVDFPHA
jgi:hypothetical protein